MISKVSYRIYIHTNNNYINQKLERNCCRIVEIIYYLDIFRRKKNKRIKYKKKIRRTEIPQEYIYVKVNTYTKIRTNNKLFRTRS